MEFHDGGVCDVVVKIRRKMQEVGRTRCLQGNGLSECDDVRLVATTVIVVALVVQLIP